MQSAEISPLDLLRKGHRAHWATGTVLLLLALLVSGCSSIGPPTLKRDRFDYSDSLSKSAQEQMLLNLVRLRYVESPVFFDVTSVVNSYSIEVRASGSWNILPGADTQTAQGGGSYSDRPTVSYAPRRGEAFTRSLLRPVPPASIVALAQAGWPVDFVFSMTVNSINGLQNRFGAGDRARDASPGFVRLMALLRDTQKSGSVGIRIENRGGVDTAVLFFTRGASEAVERKLAEAKQLLQLDPDAGEYNLTYGALARNDKEVAILSRSLLEIMTELSSFIDVPPEDVAEGRTFPGSASGRGMPPLIAVKHSPEDQEHVFTKVRYRDQWLWIDDRDFRSKRTFAFLMVISSLTETTGSPTAPILTIPTG